MNCEQCGFDLKKRPRHTGFVARYVDGVVSLFCDNLCASKWMRNRPKSKDFTKEEKDIIEAQVERYPHIPDKKS